jgi:hypothetical protein
VATAREDNYVYLTLPPNGELRSCLGLVVAGMSARARIGIGGLEDFVEALERLQVERGGTTRFRFLYSEDRITAEVEAQESEGWRLVAEMVA